MSRTENETGSHPQGLITLDFNDPISGILAYRVEGKVTAEQGHEVFTAIGEAAEEGRKLRLYYEIEGLPTAAPSVYLEKVRSLPAIFKTLERMALVGDQGWLGIYAKLFDPITRMEIRHFLENEADAAIAWLRESD